MPDSLEHQIQRLVDEAPQDGKTPQAMAAIAPIFLQIAQQLSQVEYFILQSLNQNWQITTLQNRHQPDITKTVIYGYATLGDATQAGQDPQLIARGFPIIDLLFQFVSLPNVDSLMLMERNAGQLEQREINQIDLKQIIQKQLELSMHDPEMNISDSSSIYLA